MLALPIRVATLSYTMTRQRSVEKEAHHSGICVGPAAWNSLVAGCSRIHGRDRRPLRFSRWCVARIAKSGLPSAVASLFRTDRWAALLGNTNRALPLLPTWLDGCVSGPPTLDWGRAFSWLALKPTHVAGPL